MSNQAQERWRSIDNKIPQVKQMLISLDNPDVFQIHLWNRMLGRLNTGQGLARTTQESELFSNTMFSLLSHNFIRDYVDTNIRHKFAFLIITLLPRKTIDWKKWFTRQEYKEAKQIIKDFIWLIREACKIVNKEKTKDKPLSNSSVSNSNDEDWSFAESDDVETKIMTHQQSNQLKINNRQHQEQLDSTNYNFVTNEKFNWEAQSNTDQIGPPRTDSDLNKFLRSKGTQNHQDNNLQKLIDLTNKNVEQNEIFRQRLLQEPMNLPILQEDQLRKIFDKFYISDDRKHQQQFKEYTQNNKFTQKWQTDTNITLRQPSNFIHLLVHNSVQEFKEQIRNRSKFVRSLQNYQELDPLEVVQNVNDLEDCAILGRKIALNKLFSIYHGRDPLQDMDQMAKLYWIMQVLAYVKVYPLPLEKIKVSMIRCVLAKKDINGKRGLDYLDNLLIWLFHLLALINAEGLVNILQQSTQWTTFFKLQHRDLARQRIREPWDTECIEERLQLLSIAKATIRDLDNEQMKQKRALKLQGYVLV